MEETFAYSLNSRDVPTLVVEMGVGMRTTKEYCIQMVDGIMNLMKQMGIWSGEVKAPRKSIISVDPDDVVYLNAGSSGVFIQKAKHWTVLKKGEIIGYMGSTGNTSRSELHLQINSFIDGDYKNGAEDPLKYFPKLADKLGRSSLA